MPRKQPVNSPDDLSGPDDDMLDLKDRLFELLMARFDKMQERRSEFVRQVTDDMDAVFHRGDACRARTAALPIFAAMDEVLDEARVSTDGVTGKLKIASITIVYLMTLRKWIKDESNDLGGTMAELDRRLDQWIRVSRIII